MWCVWTCRWEGGGGLIGGGKVGEIGAWGCEGGVSNSFIHVVDSTGRKAGESITGTLTREKYCDKAREKEGWDEQAGRAMGNGEMGE